MSGLAFLAFLICVAMTAVDVALFAATSDPFALGAAVICGAMAVANLLMGLRP